MKPTLLFASYCFGLAMSIGTYTHPANANNNVTQSKTQNMPYKYTTEKVTFNSGDHLLSGLLYVPQTNRMSNKAITIVGPVGYIKEQAPLLYAKELAARGYTTLIYDPTYHGESEGQPRRFESGEQKTKDIIASVDYLTDLDFVDKAQIYGVGICQGVNWMIKATNEDPRIKSMSLVAGHYLDPEVAELYNGGKEQMARTLEQAEKAKQKFNSTGEIQYIPIVGTVQENALLTAPPVYDWYIPWENNANGKGGQWENRITQMSVLDIWGGDVEKDLENLNKPTLVIHSDKAASGAEVPIRLFNSIPTNDKQLVWFEDQFQTMFYDDLAVINRVADHIDKWFDNK